jgi:hypothetical protein
VTIGRQIACPPLRQRVGTMVFKSVRCAQVHWLWGAESLLCLRLAGGRSGGKHDRDGASAETRQAKPEPG